jgi:prephenate dehydrogenase
MFSRITILGLGLIGGSLCKAIKRKQPGVYLTGVDLPNVVQKIRKAKLVDRAIPVANLAESCTEADLIVLATPIRPALELLPVISQYTNAGAIVTDVCSLKTEIVAAGQELFTGRNGWFAGGHPMAGSEHSGFQHADPFLFENAIYVLSPAENTPQNKVAALGKLVETIGAQGVIVSPQEHDRIAAAVSHLPQILAVTLMNYVAEKNSVNSLYLKMAAGGFRDMTRIASSPYAIWKDISIGNRQKITEEIDGFVEALQHLGSIVGKDELGSVFENAARNRLSIPKDTRGFLTPQFDLTVIAEDKPGVIAQIAMPLAQNKINIKDIEVLKVRENEGGTIRLAFESIAKRKQARKLLASHGFVCQER